MKKQVHVYVTSLKDDILSTISDKNYGKTAIWIILCFHSLPPLSNVKKQWPKIGSSYVMGSQHCIVREGEF